MIPVFPNFKKIEIEDKKSIEEHTHKYLPYSDFNFTSLWAWDTSDKRMVSILNDNLVVRFTDYETGELSLSFLGNNKPAQTIHELIKFAKAEGISPVLQYVPMESIKDLQNPDIQIEEDKDNFDYIFSIPKLIELKGIKYKEKRHAVTRFIRENPQATFEIKKINDPTIHEQIISLFHAWEDKKYIDKKSHKFEHKHEEKAIHKLLQLVNNNKLIISCVLLNNIIIGFSIDEVLPMGYALSHFIKADITYNGVYDFLNKKVAEYLTNQEISLWNWEQDLGLEHLKRSKESYHPVDILKKYKISLIKKG